MNYFYYPGCSLEASAIEYDTSTRAVMKALGAELVNIDDWTCCGATAAEPVSPLLSYALAARNLALAESRKLGWDILVPCSACYVNLKKAELEPRSDPVLKSQLIEILAVEGLTLKGSLRVRHLLDIFSTDINPEAINKNRTRDLAGLKLAPYYGCQCLRPYAIFDDPEEPRSMEPFIRATGADVFNWDMGAQCCGASQMSTKPDSALLLVKNILKQAKGTDAIVTVCPMCQLNLEAFQKQASTLASEDLSVSVLYLPQVLGLAMGLSWENLLLAKNLSLKQRLSTTLKQVAHAQLSA